MFVVAATAAIATTIAPYRDIDLIYFDQLLYCNPHYHCNKIKEEGKREIKGGGGGELD